MNAISHIFMHIAGLFCLIAQKLTLKFFMARLALDGIFARSHHPSKTVIIIRNDLLGDCLQSLGTIKNLFDYFKPLGTMDTLNAFAPFLLTRSGMQLPLSNTTPYGTGIHFLPHHVMNTGSATRLTEQASIQHVN